MEKNYLREVILQMVQNEELPRSLSPNLVLPKSTSLASILTQKKKKINEEQKTKNKKNKVEQEEEYKTESETDRDYIHEIDETDKREVINKRRFEKYKQEQSQRIQTFSPCELCKETFSDENIITTSLPIGEIKTCPNCFNKKYQKTQAATTVTSYKAGEFKKEIESMNSIGLSSTNDFIVCTKEGNKNFDVYKDNTKVSEITFEENFPNVQHVKKNKLLFSNSITEKANIFDIDENKTINFDLIYQKKLSSKISKKCFKCKKNVNEFFSKSAPVGMVYICEECGTNTMKKSTSNSTFILNQYDLKDKKLIEMKKLEQVVYDEIFSFPERNLIFLKNHSTLSVFKISKNAVVNTINLENEWIVEIKKSTNDCFAILTNENHITYHVSKNFWAATVALREYHGGFMLKENFGICCMCKKTKKFIWVDLLVGREKCCQFCISSILKNEIPDQCETAEYDPTNKKITKGTTINFSDFKAVEMISATDYLGIKENELVLKKGNDIIQILPKKVYKSFQYDEQRDMILAKNGHYFDFIDMKGNVVKSHGFPEKKHTPKKEPPVSMKRKLENEHSRGRKRRKKMKKYFYSNKHHPFDEEEDDEDDEDFVY
eukprot:gene11874-5201_t